jgi:hypothetical protein
MSCCKEYVKLEVDNLKQSALEFGFDFTWITEIISQYGDDVLNLVLEAVRGGFSKDFVAEVLSKFGPLLLEFLVNLLNKNKMRLAMSGDVVVGEEVGVLDASILEVLIQKYLPVLLDKYKDQVVQMLVNWLSDFLKNLTTK